MEQSERLAWAAGYLTARGTFLLPVGRPMLVIKTTIRGEGLQQFIDCVDMGIVIRAGKQNGKPGERITLSGSRLHELMTKLWPYLPISRKLEYAELRRAAKRWKPAQ